MMHNFDPNILSVSYCVWSHAILHKQFIDILLIKLQLYSVHLHHKVYRIYIH